jgi:uncharacterized protein YllA (UPF0747 family)
MDQKIDITSNNITIDVKNQNYLQDNYRTILFQDRGLNREIVSNLEIDISDANYKSLGEKLYPHGLMPESFEEKLALLNYLIEDIGPVYDYENKGWYISKVRYDKDEDKLYFDCEEER